jgi:hypothetical protein
MRRVVLLSLLTVALAWLASCSSGSRQSSTDGGATLSDQQSAKGLHIPTLPAGADCPRAGGEIVSKAFGLALGDGPVYPVFAAVGQRPGTLDFRDSKRIGNFYAQKVLWIARPSYQGPILIRGARIDQPGEMRFILGQGGFSVTELRLDANGDGEPWDNWPSSTLVREPGCYAYQIDGEGFSTVVVFTAVF